MFVHFFIQFPLPHFVQILPLLVNGKHIKNGGQAYGFSCNYFYEDCPLAEGIHYTGDEWKSSTRVSVFNTFEVWKYVVPFFLISFFSLMYAQMMFILKCPCVIEGVKLDVNIIRTIMYKLLLESPSVCKTIDCLSSNCVLFTRSRHAQPVDFST